MPRKILILQGHPDTSRRHLCHMLAAAYEDGARRNGHDVRMVDLSTLEFPLLRSKDEWETSEVPGALREAQQSIQWAEHLVLVFPLWLGGMPASLHAFLEQVLRPGFAFMRHGGVAWTAALLRGRSARIVITMGMPAPVYRWYFGAHALKALKRNVLGFVGISPVRATLIGMVEDMDDRPRRKARERLERLGRAAR